MGKKKTTKTKRILGKKIRFRRKKPLNAVVQSAKVRGPGMGAPDIMRVPFRYADIYKFNDGVHAIMMQVWNVNGLYDVDKTNVGHSPLYSTQWSNIYTTYLVEAFSIRVELMNISGGEGIWGIIGFSFNDPSNFSLKQCDELPFSKRFSSISGGGIPTRCRIYATAKALAGYRRDIEAIDNFAGVLGTSNPTTVLYGFCMCSSHDYTMAVNGQVRAEIIQYSKLYNRKNPVYSPQTGGETGASSLPPQAYAQVQV